MIDIEKLDNLPKRESRWQYITRKYGNMRELRWKDPETDPWAISDRVIENNIGKNFDLAFHYYCTKVDKRYQYIFLDEFNNTEYDDYTIDENNNIQRKPYKYCRNSRPATFYSLDYKEEDVYKKGIWCKRILSGWKKKFENRRDLEYLRLLKEKKKILIRKKRELERLRPEYELYILRNIEWTKKEKENNINNIKIQSHGFDENSFKGIEYHGQKRKRSEKYK